MAAFLNMPSYGIGALRLSSRPSAFRRESRDACTPDLQFSNGNEYSRCRGTLGPGSAPPGSSPGASGMTKREAALRGEGVGASLANAAPSGGDFLGPGMVRA